MTTRTARYLVAPISDAMCSTVDLDAVVARTSKLSRALGIAASGRAYYGHAIVDTRTGLIDSGWGFGVDAPEAEDY